MSVNLKFSNAVYNGRNKLGLTQEQTAEIIDISRSYYQRIEKGIRLPGTKVFLKLVFLLDIDLDILKDELDFNIPEHFNLNEKIKNLGIKS